jgi:hypothetical protein
MMPESQQTSPPEWVRQARGRGLGHALGVALDVLEPLGPLGAQLLFVVQPVLGLWLPREALDGLARALEAPGGMAALREQLEGEQSARAVHERDA